MYISMNEKQPFFTHYINEKNSNFGSFFYLTIDTDSLINVTYTHLLNLENMLTFF